MELQDFLGKVVVFQPGEDNGVSYGCVVGVESSFLQVVKYAESVAVSTLDTKRRRITDENAVIRTLQSNLKRLRAKCESAVTVGSSDIEYTLLQWAKKRLREIEKKQWLYLGGDVVLSESSKLVCSSAIAIMQNMDTSRDWKTMKHIISGDSFIETLCSLDERRISEDLYRTILDQYVANPLFSFEYCRQECRAIGALQKWVTAFLDNQRVLFFSTNGIEIKQQIDSCVNEIREAQLRRQELKNDVRLILSGCLLERTETVQNIPVAACLHVLDGSFSDDADSLSRSRSSRKCDAVSSVVAEKGDAAVQTSCGVLYDHLVSFDGTLDAAVCEKNLVLKKRCEQLEYNMEQCKLRNSLLQQEVDKLKAEAVNITDSQNELRSLEAKVSSLQEEKLILMQEISRAKEKTTNGNVWQSRYQQAEEHHQRRLANVLQLFGDLDKEHQWLLKEHEVLSHVCAKMIDCLRGQASLLVENIEEMDVVPNAFSKSRQEPLGEIYSFCFSICQQLCEQWR